MILSGKFVWNKLHEETWNNVKFLCSLKVKNYIFQPHVSCFLISDASAVEQGLFLVQFVPEELDIYIVTCQSRLLTEAERRKTPIQREADAVD